MLWGFFPSVPQTSTHVIKQLVDILSTQPFTQQIIIKDLPRARHHPRQEEYADLYPWVYKPCSVRCSLIHWQQKYTRLNHYIQAEVIYNRFT